MLDLTKTITAEVKTHEIAPKDFNMIKPNRENRIIDFKINGDAHIKKLVKSMKKHGFDKSKPIIVNSKGTILSGHHRFEAAKIAKVSIIISIDDNADFLDITNRDEIVKKWSTDNFIVAYAKNIPSYKVLLAIRESYSHFPVKLVLATTAGIANEMSGNVYEGVRTGAFKFPKGRRRHEVEQELDEIQTLHDLIPDDIRSRTPHLYCSLAYLWLKKQKGYNRDWFMKVVRRNRGSLCPQAGGMKANRRMLAEIYNRGKRKNQITAP